MSLSKPFLTAVAETCEQLEALLLGDAGLIYLESAYFGPETWSPLCERAHGAGKRLGLRFPQILRADVAGAFSAARERLTSAGFDAWLLRNTDTIGFLQEEGLLAAVPELVTDYTLYAWNSSALAELHEILAMPFVHTLPLELSEGELEALCRAAGEEAAELVVYGRAPMMVSAQCVKRTANGCDRTPSVLYLRDRKGMELPVKTACRYCYNTIYNALPTRLYDLPELPARFPGVRFRYEFTTESGPETAAILAGTMPFPLNTFTRGHFRKGVQ